MLRHQFGLIVLGQRYRVVIRPHRELREINRAQDQLNFQHDSRQFQATSWPALLSRISASSPGRISLLCCFSFPVFELFWKPHSALKPIIQVATVNSATLDPDLKCSPTDFRRSWRALPYFLFTIPAEL